MFIYRRPQYQRPSISGPGHQPGATDPGRRAGRMLPRTWLIRESVRVDSRQRDEPYSGTELRPTTQLRFAQADRTHRTFSRETRLATAADTLVRAVREA